jgi:hypothetical protein
MMDDKKALLSEDDEIEIIEDEGVSDDGADDEDERLEADQREDDDDGDGHDASPGADNSRRARRKRSRDRQKEFAKQSKEKIAFYERQLAEAHERLAALEARNVQTDAQTAEAQLRQAQSQVQRAENELKEAVETGDGDRVIKAIRLRDEAAVRVREADELRKRLNNPQLQQKPGMDPQTENHAQQWMSENPWFDPNGTDEDSVIARAIDEAWAQEARRKGVNPSSEDYWDELDARVKRRLGKAGSDRERRKATPPVTGRGDTSRPSTRKEQVYVTPERKRALQEAGVWDDPELRKRYLRRYAEYDRANGTSR